MAKKKATVQVSERVIRHHRKDYADHVNPEMYTHLAGDTDKRTQQLKRQGYEFLDAKDVADTDGYVKDGRVYHGDRVAMFIPQERYDRLHRERRGQVDPDEAEMALAEQGTNGGSVYVGSDDGRTRSSKMYNIPIDLKS